MTAQAKTETPHPSQQDPAFQHWQLTTLTLQLMVALTSQWYCMCKIRKGHRTTEARSPGMQSC